MTVLWCADNCDDPDDNEVSLGDVVAASSDKDDGCNTPSADLDSLCRTHGIPSHILHLKRLNNTAAASTTTSGPAVAVYSISTVLRGSHFGPFDCSIADESTSRCSRRRRRHDQLLEDGDDGESDDESIDWTLQVSITRTSQM